MSAPQSLWKKSSSSQAFTGQDKHSLLEVHGDLIGGWHHLQPIISIVWHTGCIFWGPLAFWKPMKVREINLLCDWLVGPHAVQLRGKGDRLAVVKKLRIHHSLSFLVSTFNGGRRRSGLGVDLNSKPFSRRTFQEKKDIITNGRLSPQLASLSQTPQLAS